jgi:predicted DNA-binding transcriptional regulator AlpA
MSEVRDRASPRAVQSLALKAPAAAAALDISLSTFLALVAEGKMPKPVKIPGHGGLALYDYEAIRDAWQALTEAGEASESNEWD